MNSDGGRPELGSVVTPVHNEAATVGVFHERLTKALAPFEGRYRFEFLLSDNASTDDTAARVAALRARDPRVQLLALSRNYGYQASMVAGMRQASGDAVIFIDADCEDPPEMLPHFIAAWGKGSGILYG